jgi:hypothetical protein
MGHVRGHLLSFFMFVAWLVAAGGWLKLVAFAFLAYPAWILIRFRHDRRLED